LSTETGDSPARHDHRGGGGRRRWLRRALASVLVLGLLGAAALGAVAWSFLRDLPDLQSVEDYRPPLTSRVLDRDGRLIGEYFVERRRLSPIDRIPRHTQLAFVAAEDSSFFEHSGIDYVSILRAAWVDLTAGEIKQGASTITMQLVKQLLLTPERAFRRKLREMILARRIEQHFTKQEILFLYLNHIYFGHGAYGVGEAAFTYFDKSVEELTVGESALLAGLPQRPSAYSPFRHPERAERRRRYVLRRMLEDGIIERAAYDQALESPPELSPPAAREDFDVAAYFVEEVRRTLFDRLGGETVLEGGLVIETTLDMELQRAAVESLRRGLEDHDRRQGWRGPVRSVAASEVWGEAARLAEENDLAVAAGEEAAEESDEAPDLEETEGSGAETPDAQAGEQEGSSPEEDGTELPADEPLLAVVVDVDSGADAATVAFAPGRLGKVHLDDVSWAREPDPSSRPRPVRHIERIFSVGDVARFVRLERGEQDAEEAPEAEESGTGQPPPPPRVTLFQEPIVQGALLSLDVDTHDVLAMVGGYDFEKSQFNRAIQARRQPGSAFKPFIYGAALSRGYTPVDIVHDRPVVYEDPNSGFVWRPQNYSRHFYGPLPLRTALVRSVNNATVHLFRDLGVDYVIDYARRLGIQAPLARDLSLALGSSSLTLLELTRAYAVFPNEGRRVLPRFIRRVTDRDGRVLLEEEPLGEPPVPGDGALAGGPAPEEGEEAWPEEERLPGDRVVSEGSAYLMCDLLMAVVKDPRGTGWRLRKLGRPLGGKTGTTNDQADAWFMGFSPGVVTGVWVGHDESRLLGWGETGSRAAAPVWVDYMKVALADRPIRDFEVPDEIVFQRIDRETGLLADADTEDAYFQPFIEGTAPTETSANVSSASDTRRALRADSF